MTRSLWVSKTGMDVQQSQLDITSNNLMNVNMMGFKRSRATSEDLLYQNVREPGVQSSRQTTLPSGIQIGTGTRIVATERLHTQGNLQQTGNSTDMTINGNDFFQVQMPDGTLTYTRDGSFQVNTQGQLVISSGYPAQPTVTVPQNVTSLTIDKDGAVAVTAPDMVNNMQVGTFQLIDPINPAGLRSMGENLHTETETPGIINLANPGSNGVDVPNQNYVETSNVNVVEEMVNMVQAQRAYEINGKSVQTSDQMLGKLSQL